MLLFDTHCHISLEPFDEDRAEVIRRMQEAGREQYHVRQQDTTFISFILRLQGWLAAVNRFQPDEV